MIYFPHALTDALHQACKAVQNVLEWSCGVSAYLAAMLTCLRARHPQGHIACTRKTIPGDWSGAVTTLRQHAPEKKVVVEADTPEQALAALRAQPDVLQLDKFTPLQAQEIARQAPALAPRCTLALTGGITLDTLARYLDCGIALFITSAPWYAPPADIRVSLFPPPLKNNK